MRSTKRRDPPWTVCWTRCCSREDTPERRRWGLLFAPQSRGPSFRGSARSRFHSRGWIARRSPRHGIGRPFCRFCQLRRGHSLPHHATSPPQSVAVLTLLLASSPPRGTEMPLPTFPPSPQHFIVIFDSPGGRGVGRSVLCGAFVWGSNSSNATTGAGHSATEDKSSITLSTGDGDGDLLANFGKVVAL